MHMNSVPQHLPSEDRQEYERVLDEALRSAPHRPELAAVGQRLNSEQLRTMALNATALITAAATTEYQHYVKVREELRHPASSGPSPATRESGSQEQGTSAGGLAATMGEMAAAIFLLVGYLLKMLDPGQTFAQTMLTTGWVFGAVTVVAILVAAVGLLLTALRNRPSAESGFYDARDEEVARARDAWHEALLERGILPFLRDALSDPGTAALRRTEPAAPGSSRMPHLGYGRPGFTSPDGGPDAGPRPSYSSPDYSSPDFGGPEHRTE